MTKKQNNEFRMFMTTQLFMDEKVAVWSDNPKAIIYKGGLDEIISRIGDKSEEANSMISVADRKDRLSALIELKVSSLSGFLQAYAADIEDIDLAKAIKVSKSSLNQMKEEELVSFSSMLVAKANEFERELADYGVKDKSLQEIKAIVDEFGALIGRPRNILNSKYVALGSLDELFTEGRHLLKNKMDNIMLNYRETNPEFHDGYSRSRTIIDL